MFWTTVGFAEVDFDVGIVGVAEGGFGYPGEEEGRGGNGRSAGGPGSKGVGGGFGGGRFLLDESYEAGDVVFGGGGGVDIDLGLLVGLPGLGIRGKENTLDFECKSFTPLPVVVCVMVL